MRPVPIFTPTGDQVMVGTAKTNDEKQHSRDKILKAAITHFAENGFKNSSVRAICNAAGVNHALVVYNFGSKTKLYQEVLEWCMREVCEPRLKALDQLEAASGNKPVALKKLVDAYIRGFFEGYGESNSAATIYLRFFGQTFASGGDSLGRASIEIGHEFRERFLAAFEKTLPDFPREELIYRMGAIIGTMVMWRSEVTFMDDHLNNDLPEEKDVEHIIETLVAMGCSIFRTKPVVNTTKKPKPS